MNEKPQELMGSELKDRISQLESQLARMSEQLRMLEIRLKEESSHLHKLWVGSLRSRADIFNRFERVWERIKGMEVKVFPNLQNDVDKICQILGTDGVPAEPNSLDSRKLQHPPKDDTNDST